MSEARCDRNLVWREMSEETFANFSAFVKNELGIKMPFAKKTMLQARLLKRLRRLGMKTFDEYHDYVFSPQGMEQELPRMIDVVTTHKTDFFREPQHFEYLTQHVVPTLLQTYGTGIERPLKVWCAGCSNGKEPYTVAMVLSEFAENYSGFRYGILATDISTQMLEEGAEAIYDHKHIEPIPIGLRKKYILRSKDKHQNSVRIAPELRARVKFHQLNFMDEDFGLAEMMDIIFCRNVIIYFDRPTQETVLNKLCQHLKPGGFLFMGPSESLNGMNLPLIAVKHTIYRKPCIVSDLEHVRH